LFSIFFGIPSNHFEPHRTPEHALQRRAVTLCRPEFQFDISGGAETDQIVVTARNEVDPGHRLGMAAVQAFGESYHRRQRPHGLSRGAP